MLESCPVFWPTEPAPRRRNAAWARATPATRRSRSSSRILLTQVTKAIWWTILLCVRPLYKSTIFIDCLLIYLKFCKVFLFQTSCEVLEVLVLERKARLSLPWRNRTRKTCSCCLTTAQLTSSTVRRCFDPTIFIQIKLFERFYFLKRKFIFVELD